MMLAFDDRGPINIEDPTRDPRSLPFVHFRLYGHDTGDPSGRDQVGEFSTRQPTSVEWRQDDLVLEVSNSSWIASDLVKIEYEFVMCVDPSHGVAEGFTRDHFSESAGSSLDDHSWVDSVPAQDRIKIAIPIPPRPFGLANIYFRARVSSLWSRKLPPAQWNFRDDPAVVEATLITAARFTGERRLIATRNDAWPAETSLARMLGSASVVAEHSSSIPSFMSEIEKCLNAALPGGTEPLTVSAIELHLIRGLTMIDLGEGPVLAVAYPPEFLFVAEIGEEERAGVSVIWNSGPGYGDPKFPDLTTARLRIIKGEAPEDLLYPGLAGEILIGTDPQASRADIELGLENAGLSDIHLGPSLTTCRCVPFKEREICDRLVETLSFVRHAGINRVARVQLNPGWKVVRIS